MKVRHIHGRPALWKGNPEYHAWKKRQRSIRRRAAWAAKLMEEACRAYMRPVLDEPTSAGTEGTGQMKKDGA